MKIAQGQLRRLQGGPRGLVLSTLDHILTKAFILCRLYVIMYVINTPRKRMSVSWNSGCPNSSFIA